MGQDRFSAGDWIGAYRLGRELGHGGSGVVFAAERDGQGGFALKLLRPERAGEQAAQARFLREAKLAGRIQSRHVVPILELGEIDQISFIVMPLYAGGSLAGRLRERGRLAVSETIELAAQLGRGLDALHDLQIIHRDVKPSNVLFEDDRTAALTDFGVARAADSTRLTSDGQLIGTPHYLAPELIEGSAATSASDIYALGCVLFECLVGEPPFSGRSVAEIGFAHLSELPPDPRERRPGLPAEMTRVFKSALDKDPARRLTSGTAMARMLQLAHSARPG